MVNILQPPTCKDPSFWSLYFPWSCSAQSLTSESFLFLQRIERNDFLLERTGDEKYKLGTAEALAALLRSLKDIMSVPLPVEHTHLVWIPYLLQKRWFKETNQEGSPVWSQQTRPPPQDETGTGLQVLRAPSRARARSRGWCTAAEAGDSVMIGLTRINSSVFCSRIKLKTVMIVIDFIDEGQKWWGVTGRKERCF